MLRRSSFSLRILLTLVLMSLSFVHGFPLSVGNSRSRNKDPCYYGPREICGVENSLSLGRARRSDWSDDGSESRGVFNPTQF
jgi:hypothetical protein